MAFRVEQVVDTSALAAILLREDDAPRFLEALGQPGSWAISAANRTELFLVAAARLRGDGIAHARQLLSRFRIQTQAVDEALADAAAEAFLRYGKGRHPAALNFGDCFSYALARRHEAPLLFKGNDFGLTDVGAIVTLRQ